jgi:hypothetical protein
MKYAMVVAMAVGYLGGFAFSYFLARWLLYRTVIKVARITGVVFGALAIIPALFVGTIVGGNFGGSYGEVVSQSFGQGMLGVPIGLAIGIFSTIVSIMFLSTGGGVLLGKFINALFIKQTAT